MGKNNVQLCEGKNVAIQRWSLRKLSVGVASVLLGTTAYLGMGNGAVVHADTITSNNAGDDIVTNSKKVMSQNLYQNNDLQTAKGQTSTNDTGTPQTISANNQRKQSMGMLLIVKIVTA